MSKGIFIEDELMDSSAFVGLNGNAIRLLLCFYRKRSMLKLPSGKWSITNNGEIVLRYREAPSFYEGTFSRSLDKLIEHGFIDIKKPGAKNMPAKYLISDRWKHYGTEKFIKKTREKRTAKENRFKKKLYVIQ